MRNRVQNDRHKSWEEERQSIGLAWLLPFRGFHGMLAGAWWALSHGALPDVLDPPRRSSRLLAFRGGRRS